MELTLFHGQIQSKQVKGGVHDGKKAAAAPAGVPEGDCGAGALGAIARGAGAGVEPSASAIRKRVKQADRDEGRRNDGLTTFERQELRQARREIKRLRMESGTS